MKELHKTSKGFLSTYRKGRAAAAAGQERHSPYADLRGGNFGQVTTWSRTWRNYWLEGYDDQKNCKPERYTA